jgi:hypothetical protein
MSIEAGAVRNLFCQNICLRNNPGFHRLTSRENDAGRCFACLTDSHEITRVEIVPRERWMWISGTKKPPFGGFTTRLIIDFILCFPW